MGGIRLNHPAQRSCTYVVETPMRYPVPYACPLCLRVEVNKSIHLRLDAEGDVIVAPPVYEALRQVPGMGGMITQNDIANPPPLYVGAVAQPKQEVVDQRLRQVDNKTPFYIPSRTQYESRDLMPKIRVPKLRIMRKRKVV